MLAPVYIFYGFESCGDIAEETKDAGTKIPKAMRWALIWGGIGSLILAAALLLAMPRARPDQGDLRRRRRPRILGQLSSGMQDFLLLLIIFAFFSCGTRCRARAADSRSRSAGRRPSGVGVSLQGAPRFQTPVNALIAGALVSVLFVLLVYYRPSKNVDLGFITYPAHAPRSLARLVRRQRHLPVVPAYGDRGDHRPLARLGPGGRVHARALGLDGDDHRRRATSG